MIGVLLYGYLVGWIVSTIAVACAAWRLQDEQEPAAHPMLLSIIAGAVWPVLFIALAEAAFIALTQEVLQRDEPLLSVAG